MRIATCGCGSVVQAGDTEIKRAGIEFFFSCAACGVEFSVFEPSHGLNAESGTVLEAIHDAIQQEAIFSEAWWRLVRQASELVGAAL